MAESMNMEMSVTAQRFKKNSKSEKSKRRGAPKGHRGATRQKPEPDRIEWKPPLTDVNVVVALI